jgi:hypothetical protein
MYSLVLGNGWGYFAPSEEGPVFVNKDVNGNPFPGAGNVTYGGVYVAPAAPPAPAPTSAPGSSASSGSSSGGGSGSGSGSTSNSNIDWSTGRPRVRRSDLTTNVDDTGAQQTGFWSKNPFEGDTWNQVGTDELYRDATVQDLQDAGEWENVGDVQNSPIWQGIRNSSANPNQGKMVDDLANDPQGWASWLMNLTTPASGNDWSATPGMLERMFDDQGLSDAQYGGVRSEATEAIERAKHNDWGDVGNMGIEMLTNIAVAMGLGNAFGGLGGALGAFAGGAPASVLATGAEAGMLGAGAGTAIGKAGAASVLGGGGEAGLRSLLTQGVTSGAEGAWEAGKELLTAAPEAAEAVPALSRVPLSSTPASTTVGPDGEALFSRPAMTMTGGNGMLPLAAQTGSLSLTDAINSGAQLDAEDAKNRETLEAGDQLSQEPTAKAPSDFGKYANLAKAVYSMLGGDAKDAPTREGTEDDAQYVQELTSYLGLDPQTMAEAGLEPGSQQYMDYILQQADSIIGQVIGDDFDMSSEELSAALRGKSQAEMQQLQRALYVRGQMQQMMGSGTYTDPFSGQEEEVTSAGMFNPNVGAAQRGYARKVEELGGMQGQEAYDYLQDMIGRKGDPFGAQVRADEAFERAKLEEDDIRRKRGMLSY